MGLKIYLGLLIIITLFIVGCSTTTDTTPGNIDTGVVDDLGVHRTVELDGDMLTVTLHVVIADGVKFYLFEENLPSNAEFVQADVDKSGDTLKHVVFSNAVSTSYEYTLKVSSGTTLVLGGVYALDGMDDPVPIMGITEVNV